MPGAELEGVHLLRSLSDVDRIRAGLEQARRVVIVGGGFIGLEAAAVLVTMGRDVTVLEAQDRVLPRVVAPSVAEFFAAYHAKRGVKIETGVQVTGIGRGSDGTLNVMTANGTDFAADIVIVGIGVLPNVELAQDAGIVCENGIAVDEFTRTSDDNVFAAGDCSNHPNCKLVRRVRLETVHNAVEQAKTTAATLAGEFLPYRQTPWVWSDQYDLRMQAVGVHDDYDDLVVRGNVRSNRFSVFYFRQRELRGMNAINRPADFGACRRMLNDEIPLTPEQAADENLDLRALVPPQTRFEFDPPWPSKAKVVTG